jgi:hypothetical protein
MGRKTRRQRSPAPGFEFSVRTLHRAREHPYADIRGAERLTRARAEDKLTWSRFDAVAVLGELATQDGQHVHDPHAGVGLGLPDADCSASEVHIGSSSWIERARFLSVGGAQYRPRGALRLD